jgi:DNA-binding transcriptional regulator YhcF (GntR family)
LAQEGVASQEDLANALGVDVRTIKRDFAVLEGRGILLPTRGNLHGIGRGQTHKAQIIQRWLRGETYDQLALHTRHSRTCISRYIQTFVRVVELHQQGFPSQEVAYLTQCGLPLVSEYLAVYRSNDEAASRERLQEQLKRFQQRGQAGEPAKKGAR